MLNSKMVFIDTSKVRLNFLYVIDQALTFQSLLTVLAPSSALHLVEFLCSLIGSPLLYLLGLKSIEPKILNNKHVTKMNI